MGTGKQTPTDPKMEEQAKETSQTFVADGNWQQSQSDVKLKSEFSAIRLQAYKSGDEFNSVFSEVD